MRKILTEIPAFFVILISFVPKGLLNCQLSTPTNTNLSLCCARRYSCRFFADIHMVLDQSRLGVFDVHLIAKIDGTAVGHNVIE